MPGSVRIRRGPGRVVAELLAQLAHVHPQVVALGPVARAPHLAQQVLLREELAGIARQLLEQRELGAGEVHGLARPGHEPPGEVDLEVSSSTRTTTGAAGGVRNAPQRGADPGEQLLGVERLRHVVVGAGVERAHLLRLVVARGQHDHGDLAERPQPAQHVEAVEVGEAEVEEHDVGAAVGGDHDARPRPSRLRARRSRGCAGVVRSARRSAGSSSIRRIALTADTIARMRPPGDSGPIRATAAQRG